MIKEATITNYQCCVRCNITHLAQLILLSDSDVTRNFTLGGLKPMASAEREAITGVWGQSPQRGPGAEPEAESFFVDVRP